MEERYVSVFGSDQKPIVTNDTNTKVSYKEGKKMGMTESTEEILTNAVLMLNQVLKEFAELNHKVDNFSQLLTEIRETNKIPMVENTQGIKKKMTLVRDENGKILGADVIEVAE